MKISTLLGVVLAVVMILVDANSVVGQNRSTGGFGATGQQNAFGTQSSFGGQNQAAFGPRGGQQGGQFGLQTGQNQQRVGGQDGFVGTDANQIRNQAMSGRQQRRALFDFAVESLNEMRDARRERNARRNAPAPVRVQLRPLFTVEAPDPQLVTARVQSSLSRAMPAGADGTNVTVNGSRATIEGSVGSEYERKLAAKMVSLTPGIYDVDNRLSIQPTTNPQ